MRTLNRDFKLMCQRNRDGSFATQHDRERLLTMMANQLHEDGFRNLRAQGLRTKHVEHLVSRWQAEGASSGTMKNRMSALRWVAEKIGKENIVARDNAAYGIADRRYVTNESKAKELNQGKALAGNGSLIPTEMSYRDQLNRFKAQTAFAGIDRVHGFRHAYAQARYAELTGWKAPAAGGPTSKQLNPEQKAIDRQARLTISRELGHEREQITAVYLGR